MGIKHIMENAMKTLITPLFVTAVTLVAFSGCTAARIETPSIRATSQSPEVSVVEQTVLPFQADKPSVVLAVEPFEMIPALYSSQDSLLVQSVPNNEYLRAKLITALGNVGNFSVLDPRGLQKKQDGTVGAALQKNELGPYLVRATVTEFSESVEESAKKREFSAGALGIALGVAGLITDKPGLLWPGAGLAVANPNFESATEYRKGMVAFDVQIVDGRTMRVVKSLKASGSFSREVARTKQGVFGYQQEESEKAQSILGQATQAAYNDLIEKLSEALLS